MLNALSLNSLVYDFLEFRELTLRGFRAAVTHPQCVTRCWGIKVSRRYPVPTSRIKGKNKVVELAELPGFTEYIEYLGH